MKEDPNDILEPFNVIIEDSEEFIENKCPNILKQEKYKKWLDYGNKFYSSKIVKFIQKKYGFCQIFFNCLFSVTFYLLLLTIILTRRVMSIILFVIIYILGQIIQTSIIPKLYKYKSKLDFENIMNKILNGYVEVYFLTKEGKKSKNVFKYPGKYITDVTGEINIPKKYKYIKIGKMQYFVEKKDFIDFSKKYKVLFYKQIVMQKKIGTFQRLLLKYKDEKVVIREDFYNLNANSETYSIGFLVTFLSILMLQWIYALISLFSFKEEYIIIYPAKLITKNEIQTSPTKIVIHGKKFNNEKYVESPVGLKDFTKLENKYEEYEKKRLEREKKEEERRMEIEKKEMEEEKKRTEEEKKRTEEEKKRREEEKKRRENTETLSRFGDNNYYIKVYRVYEDVHLVLNVYQKEEDYENEWYLGKRNINIKEEKKQIPENNSYIYVPNGLDIKIQITYYEYKYHISIGEIFNKSFYYYD